MTRLVYATCPVSTCDMTCSYMRHDSFIHATWLVHMHDMTRSYDSFICVTWLLHMTMCNMTYMRHDSFTCTTWLVHTCDCHIFIGKVVNICLGVSINLVYKFKRKSGTTTVKHDFHHLGLKFHRGSPWVSVLSWLNLKANKDYVSYEYMRSRVKSYISCHIHESSICTTWLVHTCDCHIHEVTSQVVHIMSHTWRFSTKLTEPKGK